jgi:hypothetical protein
MQIRIFEYVRIDVLVRVAVDVDGFCRSMTSVHPRQLTEYDAGYKIQDKTTAVSGTHVSCIMHPEPTRNQLREVGAGAQLVTRGEKRSPPVTNGVRVLQHLLAQFTPQVQNRSQNKHICSRNPLGFPTHRCRSMEAGMGKINLGRVVLGGLLAGLIIVIGEYLLNMVFLGRQYLDDALASLNRPPVGTESLAFYVILTFALGIFSVWVYAAIRPRYGAGPMTAICAGIVVWFLAVLYANAMTVPMHLFPRRLLFYATLWEFFEYPIATLAGAWIYKE